ncbi:helix-turn-helix domain-containing protein [Bradymonas sediminis]|uniref:Insertion element IS150 protein InsJ-like helix-turn-helix domain-containing protein n=1 Tax=Bradymonas sediminis TaxID=1548548 RepID=A0A2Z4FH34_9DELT|nr:hypothetical protein DN745_02525 [Bradymonas sediminis]
MPDAYSIILRKRVVDAWEANEGSQAAIAERFNVSPSSVERWIKLKRESGCKRSVGLRRWECTIHGQKGSGILR